MAYDPPPLAIHEVNHPPSFPEPFWDRGKEGEGGWVGERVKGCVDGVETEAVFWVLFGWVGGWGWRRKRRLD